MKAVWVNTLIIAAAVTVLALSGCGEQPIVKKDYLTIDFNEQQTLTYQFVSKRDIYVEWPEINKKSGGQNKVDKSSESVEFVMEYTPVAVDLFGLSTLKATCKSVKTERKGKAQTRNRKDAVELLEGKSFQLKVDPAGKIRDYSQLKALLKEAGENAFSVSRNKGRIKNPDMISDFFATQWFLFDAIASVENPSEGVTVGQTWHSILSVPTPMVTKKARDVTYSLSGIRQTDGSRTAVIQSTYKPAETVPPWPMPYEGRFQMRGMFGFLRAYQVLDLQGQGELLYDMNEAKILSSTQKYFVKFSSSFPMGLNITPKITLDQTITMKLISDN